MVSPLSLRPRPALSWLRIEGGVRVWLLAACAVFLFVDGRDLPIQLWDESRTAANALEMHAHGFSLVTTYGDRPDLWNTKPPLLIWAMAASLSAFGVSETALRLPTAAAALALLALVFGFTRRLSGSRWTAALATILLTLSAGFFGEHAARTADYDVPLTLFVAVYARMLFFLLHRRRPSPQRLALAAASIAAATLTKGIAGVTPGLGIVAYLLIVGRWRRVLTPPYVAMGVGAATPVASFLAAREHASPGYLQAAWFNDVAGRFGAALDGHGGPPWAYLDLCFVRGWFSGGLAAAASPLALGVVERRLRLGLIFSLCMAAAILGVDSLAATKLHQYAEPAYPFLAIASALAAHGSLSWLARRRGFGPSIRTALVAFVLCCVAGRSLALRYADLPRRIYQPQASYGRVFASLRRLGAARIRVVDDGVWGPGIPPGYAPQLHDQSLSWRQRGLDIARVSRVDAALATPNSYVVTCDPKLLPSLRRRGQDLAAVPDCMALGPR